MQFRDSFRAQYYLAVIEKGIVNLLSEFQENSLPIENFSSFIQNFCTELAEELDQLLLPTLVHELHESKKLGCLKGETPFERYKSFFLKDQEYTPQARLIVEKYPFLFEMIDTVTARAFENLRTCLKRFKTDLSKIRQQFSLSPNCLIENIHILSSSDRHRNQQSLLFSFSGGKKLIYKPVDLHPDQLLAQFIQDLELSTPFNICFRSILPQDGYGWLEYLSIDVCNSIDEIQDFFQRAGVLLTISNTLNYADGHCENILAHGAFPILLDCETLFQNYVMPLDEDKSIISTQLIQKFIKKQKNKVNYSAFQSVEDKRFESLFTHAIHDQTDEIFVSYRGYGSESNHHRPIFNERLYNYSDFLEEVITGFCYGYDAISKRAIKLLQHSSWWEQVACVHSRMVLRDTSAYFYLQRRIQQPEYTRSKRKALTFIKSKLGSTPYTDYEVQDTLELNIPYFYQKPGERHLYDGKNHCYQDVFSSTSIDWLKKHLTNRSEAQKLNDCALIRKYLSKKTKHTLVLV